MEQIGIVAIGRNEGARLVACLRSLPAGAAIVYVDSGSTDGSVATARAAGAAVVELARDTPFTAALARNAGLAALEGDAPYVQMIDGDCALDPGWLAAGRAALEAEPDLAAVFGRRRERFPERSVYNRLCDDEWNVPVGEARACGGDALFRAEALRGAGGYTDTLIAGEEPDLCLRLREAGWRIRRIDAEMTLHDAAMTHLAQWWRRSRRAGHAFAELAWRNRGHADPAWSKAVRSSMAWGLALPLAIVAAALAGGMGGRIVAVPLLALYPAQFLRLSRRERRRGTPPRHAREKALFLVLSRFSQTAGIIDFAWRRMRRATPKLIEYKNAG